MTGSWNDVRSSYYNFDKTDTVGYPSVPSEDVSDDVLKLSPIFSVILQLFEPRSLFPEPILIQLSRCTWDAAYNAGMERDFDESWGSKSDG